MKKILKHFIGIILVIFSGALAYIGLNDHLIGINTDLVIEQQYLFGVIPYDPYTIQPWILFFALISFVSGITLISVTLIDIYHKRKLY